MSNEHREHTRRAVEIELNVRNAGDIVEGEVMFESMDLSTGGVFLRSDLLLEVGDELDVRFTLPGLPTIHATAKVAWVTRKRNLSGEPGMGLQFTRMSDADAKALQAFLHVSA